MKPLSDFSRKRTLAIVATSSQSLAQSSYLYRKLVEYGYGFCKKDQDHPPTISVGIAPENVQEIYYNFNLAKYLGAQVIVTFDNMDASLNKIGLEILSKKNDETIRDFIKRIFDASCVCDDNEQSNSFPYPKRLCDIDQDLLRYTKKCDIVGVIGGAGPIAGASYCQSLSRNNVPYLALHDTTAPDKNNAVLGLGPDFAPDYIRDIKLLSPFIKYLTVPCNTAHAKKDFLNVAISQNNIEFVDIRDAAIHSLVQNYPNLKQVILLATPATIKERLYHQKIKDAGYEIIVPNKEQLDDIYMAIYKIKSSEKALGEKRDPKDIILQVVKDIRESQGDLTIPVILGGTELNIPFSGSEMNFSHFISASASLARECSKRVNNYNEYNLIQDSSDDEIGNLKYSWLDDLVAKYSVTAKSYEHKDKIRIFFNKKETPSTTVFLFQETSIASQFKRKKDVIWILQMN